MTTITIPIEYLITGIITLLMAGAIPANDNGIPAFAWMVCEILVTFIMIALVAGIKTLVGG